MILLVSVRPGLCDTVGEWCFKTLNDTLGKL